MSRSRTCDVCGFTDRETEAVMSWGKFSGSGVYLDICPVCATIVKSRIKILRDERKDAHVMQTHDPND